MPTCTAKGTSANRETGLFAVIENGGAIRSLGLTGVNIVGGYNNTGALVGNNKGSITGSHSTGAISGKGDTGGLVGHNNGSISKSYSADTVSGDENYVGGLVGDNIGSIERSYATGAVSGEKSYVGGLAGYNLGKISFSYASGAVSGQERLRGRTDWQERQLRRLHLSPTAQSPATTTWAGCWVTTAAPSEASTPWATYRAISPSAA